MRIAKRAAWLFVAGLAACAAIKTISREEWSRHFGGDIAQEFQTEEQLQAYTASLFEPASSSQAQAQAVGSSRERRQKQKRQFVLALEDSNLVETHAQLREAVKATGGSYNLAANGRYAIVHADADTVSRLQSEAASSVRGVLHVRGAMKVARSVSEMQCSEDEEKAGLLAALSVADEASYEESVSWLQQASSEHGWELELPRRFSGKGTPVVGVRVPCSSVKEAALQLAELESVIAIEPRPQHKLANYYAQGITQGGKVGDTPLYKAGVTGDGEIVGVSDSGIDMDHCYFEDDSCDPFDQLDTNCRKVVYYETVTPTDLPDLDDNGHGTHVAGSIAGACADCSGNKKNFRGMAYNARLAFMDLSEDSGPSLSTPGDLYNDLFGVLYDQGAKISSHSWGSVVGIYTIAAYAADEFMHDFEDALILFAAGNEGEEGASTILSPGMSKNVLSVGASLNAHEAFGEAPSKYNEDNLAEFSSRGPTFGDRLKPEVCAPGMYIESAYAENGAEPVCARELMSGTSMATPITAGNAALAREYFVAGYHPTGERNPADGFTPSGALLKAVLVHSTRRMEGRFQGTSVVSIPYPGNEQGFGRIALGDVLATPENNYFTLMVKGNVAASDHELTANGQEHHISVQMTSNSKYQRPLVATLVWIDEPSPTGVLVNNLDLFITDTDTATVYRPLWTTTMDNKDDKNPVEKVVIPEPALLGNYTVTVRAESLATAQKYALVITGTFEGNDYDVPPEESEPSPLDKLLEDLGMTKQEFTIGVVLIGGVLLFSCCCGERRRRKRGDRQRDAYYPDEVL